MLQKRRAQSATRAKVWRWRAAAGASTFRHLRGPQARCCAGQLAFEIPGRRERRLNGCRTEAIKPGGPGVKLRHAIRNCAVRVRTAPRHVTHADSSPQPWPVSWHPRPAAETSGQEPRHAEREMTRLPHRRFLQAALAVFAGVLLGACGKQPEPTKAQKAAPPTAQMAPAKVYVVGVDAAYAPFESQNEKGEIVGFSVDLMRALAVKAGMEVKFVNTPWEGIFNALAQGDRDLLISSIGITAERRQTIDFSDPYFDAHQLIVVPASSKVAKFDDLKKLKVGVQTGTSGDEVVSKLLGKNSTNIKRFESTPLALKELESGGV